MPDGQALSPEQYYFPDNQKLIRLPEFAIQPVVYTILAKPNQEHWWMLLGSAQSGIISTCIEVGNTGPDRVSISPNFLSDLRISLQPFRDKGLTVVADIHNHPATSVQLYREHDMPDAAATTPSTSDIDIFQRSVQEAVGQAFPRIIAVPIPGKRTILMSAWTPLRYPTSVNAMQPWEFHEYNIPQIKNPAAKIHRLRRILTDPVKIANSLIAIPRPMKFDGPTKLPVELNAISTAYNTQLRVRI